MINNDVLKKNTLRVRYDNDIPYFEIGIDKDFLDKFQSDYKLELTASFEMDASLRLIVHYKSFETAVNFITIIPYQKVIDIKINQFLSTFIQLNKVQVSFYSFINQQTVEKWVTVSNSVQEACKLYLGHLSTFEPGDGLKDSFSELPVGFLAPFSTSDYFLLLCKTDDSLYEKLKFASYEDIEFFVYSTDFQLTLSMTYRGIAFSSITMKKEDISLSITEDFDVLLKHEKIYFIITSSSMKNDMYLNFSKELDKASIQEIHSFFYDNLFGQKQTSLL